MLGELWSLQGIGKALQLTWFAFLINFVIWFSLAPLATTVKADCGLTVPQIRTIAICNVALTVPARILIGMLLDQFGSRITDSTLLVYAATPCLMFAAAQDFSRLVLACLLLPVVGAGFVIGIRMVTECFPPKEIGLSEGLYGGRGNSAPPSRPSRWLSWCSIGGAPSPSPASPRRCAGRSTSAAFRTPRRVGCTNTLSRRRALQSPRCATSGN